MLIHKLHDTFCCYTFYSNKKQTMLPVMCFHILFPLIWNYLYQLYIQRNFSFYVYCNVYSNHLFFILLFFLLFSFSPLFFIVILLLSVTNQPGRKLQTSIRARNSSHIQQLTQIPLQHKSPYRRKVTHNKEFVSWIRE